MRTYDEALAWARSQVTNPSKSWYNLCQQFSRMAYGAEAWAPSAREAFNIAKEKGWAHTSFPPPPGSIAYYGTPNTGFGHATPVFDGGYVYSNDIKRRGKIDKVKWDEIPQRWSSYPYRGWIDETPSGKLPVRVPVKPVTKPKKGTTVVTADEGVWARRRPSLHAEHARRKRVRGSKVHYVDVVKAGGEVWLKTRLGRYIPAKRTARGV